jgi:hypothetical protein
MPSLLSALTLVCLLAWTWPALAQQATPVNDGAIASISAGTVAWKALSSEQRNALRPLATLWPSLQPDQQRKWLALATNFNRMGPDEQETLQGRMAEWAKLSPAQRTQARLNFGEARRAAPADERRAKWEEYQALPAEERERLAKDRPARPAGAAPALRPTPGDRIVRPPAGLGNGRTGNPLPAGMADASLPVNRETLLPASAARPQR